MPVYRKYVYWLQPRDYPQVEPLAQAQGLKVRIAKKVVCLPLAPNVEVGVVPAEAWANIKQCSRQITWQAHSDKAGLTLVVSSQPLPGLTPTATITARKKFSPPRLPSPEEQALLVQRPSYTQSRPDVWEQVEPGEAGKHQRWLRMIGIRGVSFEELFLSHRANHANFIEPEFFVSQAGQKVPYSLGPTAKVCSSCLEFFGIVGGQHKTMLVTPCPGAAIFAGLAPNRYYEVSSECH